MVTFLDQNFLKLLRETYEYRGDGVLLTRNGYKDTSTYSAHTRYKKITFNKKPYLLHRLIYAYWYGFLPTTIDHVDGNPLNNQIENLKAVTQSDNILKAKVNKKSSTGIKGVSQNKDGKYVSHYCFKYKKYHVGTFLTAEEAAKERERQLEERKYGHDVSK